MITTMNLLACLTIHLLPLAMSYNDDANTDWLTSPIHTESDNTALISTAQGVDLSLFEYVIWLLYTVLTSAITACLLYLARRILLHFVRNGFRGVRSIDLRVRIHYDESTTVVYLGRRLDDQVTTVATMVESAVHACSVSTNPTDVCAQYPDDAETFHDVQHC